MVPYASIAWKREAVRTAFIEDVWRLASAVAMLHLTVRLAGRSSILTTMQNAFAWMHERSFVSEMPRLVSYSRRSPNGQEFQACMAFQRSPPLRQPEQSGADHSPFDLNRITDGFLKNLQQASRACCIAALGQTRL